MGQVQDYPALFRELLAGVAGGWSYSNLTGWWISKRLHEPELAQWLRENGATLGRDGLVRAQLVSLADLNRGDLAAVATGMLKGWEPSLNHSESIVDELDELLEKADELYFADRYREAIPYFQKVLEIQPNNYQVWRKLGISLHNLGRRYEEAIASYDRAVEINPDFHEAWFNRGVSLHTLDRCEEAIASFDRAIEIKPDYHQAWNNRGSSLYDLGRYEEAIASFDRAIETKPDKDEAWFNRGISLDELGRYEEAIASFDRTVEIKPDFDKAWFNRGISLANLGRYEEAIASYDRAVEINPDEHKTWTNRGVWLGELGRHEEAIASFNRAVEINPDEHKAWANRGNSLGELGRYEEAIASFNRAVKIKPDFYEAWYSRAIAFYNLHGYQAQINAYHQAFEHIHPDTHLKGYGHLQHQIGRTHYKEGIKQLCNYRCNPQRYYDLALTSYQNALETLTLPDFATLRLESLIDTAQVYLALRDVAAARRCQVEAVDILQDLLNQEPTFAGKKRLQIEYVSLRQLDVDLFVASGDNIRALQAAELDKNNHLTWLLSALAETTISPSYAQMQQLLSRRTGIVYWHLSHDNLTTFILHPDLPRMEVLTTPSQYLKNWCKTYDSEQLDKADWKELKQILQVSEIDSHLTGIEELILIPHRDLHRIPLHIYWEKLTTTYLPNIQVGLNLKKKPQPDRSAGFLLVESPDYSQTTKLKSITKSFDPLTNPKVESAIIAHLFQPKTTIHSGAVSKDTLCAAFNTPHSYGHFNGHAFHDSRRPQDSSLVLDGGELTCQDLAQIDLTPYYLISLSACETGITAHQSIDTEYVGLVSAFLSRGTSYVVSTLWSVKDLPSSLLMMTFYLYLNQGDSASLALYKAAYWLKNLTYAEEAQFHQNVYQRLPQNSDSEQTTARTADRNRRNAEANAKENPAGKPYSEPKYWAAFTISGWG